MPTHPGRLGVWTWLDSFSATEAAKFARQLEDWGYSTLWIPEAVGRDPFTFLGYLAAQTEKLVFATGIANIYARDAMSMHAAHRTLAEISGGRFILGLGVSHDVMVSGLRGHEYRKPVPAMREYLDAMEGAAYAGPPLEEEPPIVLGALRDGMLGLAAKRTRGAHPYWVPPEHTARARQTMGPDAWLCPEQKVLMVSDPGEAREIARHFIAPYVSLTNYQNNLRQFGMEDRDFADGGSDRLIDRVVAWGDEKSIADRIQAHWDAGADHVCIQALSPDKIMAPHMPTLEAFAPGA